MYLQNFENRGVFREETFEKMVKTGTQTQAEYYGYTDLPIPEQIGTP